MKRFLFCLIIAVWGCIFAVIFVPSDSTSLNVKSIELQTGNLYKPVSFKPLNRFGAIIDRPIFYNDITQEEEIAVPTTVDAAPIDEVNIQNLEVLGVMQTTEGWRANIIHADLQTSIWVSVGDKLGLSTVREISTSGLSLRYSDRDEDHRIYNSLDDYASGNKPESPDTGNEN